MAILISQRINARASIHPAYAEGISAFLEGREAKFKVKTKRPAAKITFKLDEQKWSVLGPLLRLPTMDTNAREEWGWKPTYDLSGLVDSVMASHTPTDKASRTETAAAK